MKERFKRPEFKFAYVNHSKEYADEAWNMVKDCDVILQEEVHDSKEEREKMEKMIAIATFRPRSPVGSALREYFCSKREEDWGCFLVANAIEMGKEFHYVDVLEPSPEIELLNDASEIHKQSLETLEKGKPLTAITLMEKSVEKYALSDRLRSQAILTQVRELVEMRGKKWRGKRIGIVQGAIHQPLSETFQTAFPGYKVKKETTRLVPPVILSTVMEKELYPEKPVDQNKLKRVMFADGILFNYLIVLNPKVDETELCHVAEAIETSLSDEEVDGYWQRIIKFDGKKNRCLDAMWDVAVDICTKFESKQTGLNG